jgi:hypothetical protein
MPHIHWVTRQNKLEIPNDEEEVNTREIHKCDGQAHDPDSLDDVPGFGKKISCKQIKEPRGQEHERREVLCTKYAQDVKDASHNH